MPRVLVIGYGNPLRGDDGFGPLAAEMIAARRLAGVDAVVTHQLGPELAAALSDVDHAVFLDADASREAGPLLAAAVEPRAMSPTALSHDFSPGGLLALSGLAYGRSPTATLLTAPARGFGHGAALSAEARAAAATAADVIAALAESGRLDTETVRAALVPPA